jgi:hypothetical protein
MEIKWPRNALFFIHQTPRCLGVYVSKRSQQRYANRLRRPSSFPAMRAPSTVFAAALSRTRASRNAAVPKSSWFEVGAGHDIAKCHGKRGNAIGSCRYGGQFYKSIALWCGTKQISPLNVSPHVSITAAFDRHTFKILRGTS